MQRILTLAARKPTRPRLRPGRLTLPLTAVGIAVALSLVSACGGSNDSASGAGGHNAADVTFATDMIPHHAQAVKMADMALEQARSTQIVTLAEQIKSAQDPEIDTMSGWLQDWNEPVPDTMSMAGMSHDMAGMMSQADMDTLFQTSGRAFDTMWLTMMVEHHQGAIEMAKTELADGSSDDAQALANDIISAQQDEISVMNKLSDDLAM